LARLYDDRTRSTRISYEESKTQVMAQNLKINILAQDKTKQAFNGIRGRLDKLKSAVFSVKGALVGIGAGVVVKSFVDTGRSIEDLSVRLKQLFGSTQEGAKAFDVMSKFASKVPFSLEQIQASAGNLAVVSGDADRLGKILEITGNVASVTGIDFQTAGEQIQRAFSSGIASADIFREKGVRDMLGFKAGATVTAEETIKAFERVFGKDGKFGGATDELANTFTGTLSMLGDKLFNFKKNVANAEFFSALKGEFKDLNKFIEENADAFETISEVIGSVLTGAVKLFSISIKGIATAVEGVRDAYEGLLNLLNKIPGIDIHFINKQQREILRDLQNYEDSIMRIAKSQETVNVTLAKGTKEIKKQKHEYKNIHQAHIQFKKQVEAQNSLQMEILDKVQKQNEEFSLSNEIFNGIKSATSSFSRSLAEALVLGKSINVSMRELAQSLLVEIVAKTIERIALKGIEKILDETLFKKEEDKLNSMRKQESSLKRQIALQLILSAIGGGGGGIPFFANGGAVSKGQPIVVGEQGAELFIPNQTGQITQSARGTGNGGATTVNFNITTVDAKGFDQLLIQRRGTISRIINESVNERGREAII
jgi:hypothetical protein